MSNSILAQSSLPHNRLSEAQRYGLRAELWSLQQLQARDYQAHLVSGFFSNVDILIEPGLPVEVKISRPYLYKVKPGHYRQRWQFDLARSLPANQDWILLAIAEDEERELWPYVLLSGWLNGRSHLQLTSHPSKFSGWIAPHLNGWQNIDTLLDWKQKQAGQLFLPLFQEVCYA